jgi:hypothetical protein
MRGDLRHYILPDGNVQIAFSGGRTSAYMLHQIIEANGDLPDRVAVTFQNTGREMPQTLDFVQQCAARWGVRVIWLEHAPKKPLTDAQKDLVALHFGAKRLWIPGHHSLLFKPELPKPLPIKLLQLKRSGESLLVLRLPHRNRTETIKSSRGLLTTDALCPNIRT